MMQTVKSQSGLGALKATGGGALAATIATVPGLQAIIDAIAAALTVQLAKLFALAGVAAPAELGDFVKWLLVFVLLHQAIYWLSNRWGAKPPAADSGESGV